MTSRTIGTFLAAFVLVSAMNLSALLQEPARAAVMAQADPTIIDFDAKVLIPQDQTEVALLPAVYLDQGVTFSDPFVVNARDWNTPPDFIHSGDQAMHQCATEQWCDDPVTMIFTDPQSQVGAWIGLDGSLAEDTDVTMMAFDAVTGGNVVDTKVLPMRATNAASIPSASLGVATTSPVIRRVVVGFPEGTFRASDLIFDDVIFSPTPQTYTATGGEEPCSSGTTEPALRFDQPKSELVVHENRFTLEGRVTTAEGLLEAKLTRESNGQTRSESLLPDATTGKAGATTIKGGAIGPNVIEHFLAPGKNTLTLEVRNCAGPARAQVQVIYEPTAEGTHYFLQSLEVTQTIQDPTNKVRLVAGKRTFVRVLLTTAGSTDTLSHVTASLGGCRVAELTSASCEDDVRIFTDLQSLNAVTVDARSGGDDLVAKRGKMNGVLLFELPQDWTTAGYLRLWLNDNSLSPKLWCDGCDNAGGRVVRFEDAPSLTVDFVDVMYTADGVPHTPVDTDRGHLLSWLVRAYPTNDIQEVSDLDLIKFDDRPTCYDVAQEMFAEWVRTTYKQEVLSDTPYAMTPTRYYGLVAAKDDQDRNPMTGCALIGKTESEDQRLDNEHFASGPAGTGRAWAWDHDGSYADWYGGHEIAHTFGRQHMGICDSPGGKDPAIQEEAEGWINVTMDGQRIDYIGFDPGDGAYDIPRSVYRADKWHDLMTYCKYRWISAYTYEALWKQMDDEEAATSAEEEGEVPAIEFIDGQAIGSGDDVDAPATPAPAQPVLLVVGTINKDQDTVDFRPLAVLPEGSLTKRDDRGEYRIVLRDLYGTVLATYPFEPLSYSDQPIGADEIAQLSEVVPWVEGTALIDIERGNPGSRIARQPVSRNAPTVSLTGPTGSGQLQGGVVPVTWDGRDKDGDTLTYSLHYSVDNGATWQSVVSGLHEDHFDVDLGHLPGSNQALFRVIATDGVLTAEDQSDVSFSVASHAPEVSIISPEDRARYGTAHTIVVVGEASDVDSGRLPESALTWTADGEGSSGQTLGQGRSITLPNLTPGRHVITLTATGRDGLTAESSITIRIEESEPEVLDWAYVPSEPDSGTLGAEGLFLYDNTDEAGTFFAGDGAGQLQPLRTFDVLLNGWSSVIPGNFGGDASTDLLFYASDLGVGEFYASDGAGGMSLLSGNEGFTKGWDLIVPVELHPDDEWTSLLFYDRAEGVAKLYTTDGSGKIQLVGAPVLLGHAWTSIVAGQFGDVDLANLLLYDRATGQLQRYTIDDQGVFAPQEELPGWNVGWDAIVPGHFGGAAERTDLFLYDAETGNATVVQADGTGNLTQSDRDVPIPGRWSSVVGGRFDASSTFTDLFFYDAVQGLAAFYTMNDQGEFQEFESMSDLTPGWDQIVPGYFGTP